MLLVSKLFLPSEYVWISLQNVGVCCSFLRSDTHVRQIRLTFIYRKMPQKKCVDRCKTTYHWELTSFVLLSDCFFSVTPIMPENKIPKGPCGEIYLKHGQCWKILDLCGIRRCFSSSTCPLTCFQGSCGCFLWLWQYARVPTKQLWIYRISMIDKTCKASFFLKLLPFICFLLIVLRSTHGMCIHHEAAAQVYRYTPPKFKMVPDKRWLEDYFSSGRVTLLGLC